MKGYSIPKEYEADFREDTRLINPDSLTHLLVESMMSCSQSHIFAILKANGLKLKDVRGKQ